MREGVWEVAALCCGEEGYSRATCECVGLTEPSRLVRPQAHQSRCLSKLGPRLCHHSLPVCPPTAHACTVVRRVAQATMRIVILGATGATGKLAVRFALEAGHSVTAVARNVSAAAAELGSHPQLTIVRGDVYDAASMGPILRGHDAVVSALGQRGLDPRAIYSRATPAVVEGMKHAGVRRLVVVTSDHDG